MKLNKFITGSLAVMASAVVLSSCTSEFDKWNTDHNSATEEDMTHDNMNTGAFFSQMQHNVFIIGLDKGADYQVEDMLTGGLFSGYFSNIKASYDVGSLHNAHYLLPDKWVNLPFNDTYTNLMQPWLSLKTNSDKNGTAAVTALGNVVKVFGMSRLADMYGPLPYTRFGTGINVAYDSQEDVYKAFFAELDDAIDVLTVGAVDSQGLNTVFSSIGPSQDGRVKPDIMARGGMARIFNAAGVNGGANGTSFASPIACGMVACLWQALPGKTAKEIISLVRSSADRYLTPDNIYGYGIPDFWRAYQQGR